MAWNPNFKADNNPENEAKYNAGIDSEKRVMNIFKEIDKISLIETGEGQKMKLITIRQLCIATRGLFTRKTTRDEIWNKMKAIQLRRQIVSVRQGKAQNVLRYDSDVNEKLDDLVIFISDKLQDERGFFSPKKDELGLF